MAEQKIVSEMVEECTVVSDVEDDGYDIESNVTKEFSKDCIASEMDEECIVVSDFEDDGNDIESNVAEVFTKGKKAEQEIDSDVEDDGDDIESNVTEDSTKGYSSDSEAEPEEVLNKKRRIPSRQEILKSLLNLKREWNSKTPLQRFHCFYGIGKTPLDIGRFAVFKEDVRPVHWSSRSFIGVIVFVAMLAHYTCYHHAMLGNFSEALPSLCLSYIVVAGIPLIHNTISAQRFRVKSLIDFGDDIFLDEHKDTEYNRICKKHMDITMRGFLIKISMIFLSYTGAVTGPLIAYFTQGVKTSTIDARITFVEDKSDTDFMINVAIMTYYAAHGGLAYVGLEVFLSMFMNVARIIPDIVSYELNQLADKWQKKSITTLELQLSFKNTVKKSIDANEYADHVCEFLYVRNFVTPVIFIFAIGLSIYCQYTIDFPAGYGIASMPWVQFYFMCDLGEIVKDNGFDVALYDAKWEVFPLKIQRSTGIMISHKQNQPGFTVGPFIWVQIDRHRFSIVSNKIYSLIMFLINFFN